MDNDMLVEVLPEPLVKVLILNNGSNISIIDRRPDPQTQEEFLQRAQEHDVAVQDALAKYAAGTIATIVPQGGNP